MTLVTLLAGLSFVIPFGSDASGALALGAKVVRHVRYVTFD